ncbi:MAG: hypothetical protein DRR08_28135 [Candidatus Parabeggiatoa sp. nov. 2]|nr:MAG: hypothetical protein B6247_25475 [Beggiatoa sp. 4572_84]RKZ52582.1 MAG: hypothetical protein DRR08_28135 [Gammaproteobacteria bacterium]
MLRINFKDEDTLLEGETYLEIFEELQEYSFLPEDDLETFVKRFLKKIQKFVNKEVNTSFSGYEAAAKELIRVGVFEEVRI